MKIISGAQTGVDRAALDAALKLGIDCGGWVPSGRMAEDGKISLKYPVKECESFDYAFRTRLNAKESDATLIIKEGHIEGGTLYTFRICKRLKKFVKVVDLKDKNAIAEIKAFLKEFSPEVLNIAGPRESKNPGIYKKSFKILLKVFED